MKQAVHIFRKDVRHNWLLTLTVLALIALHARQEMFGGGAVSVAASVSPIGLFYLLVELSTVLMPLALIFMIAIVIQDETLVGTNQFWLTRPYSRLSLILAKSAFFFVFLFLPLLAHHLFLISHIHFPVSAAISALLLTFGQLMALLVVFVAVAALTSTLSRFVLASVLSAAVSSILLAYISGSRMAIWDPLSDVRSGVAYFVVLVAGIIISGYAYATRRTTWARIAALAALCGVIIIVGLISPGTEWKIYSRFHAADSRLASVRLDPGINLEGITYVQSSTNAWFEQNFRTLSYPFQVTGLPRDFELNAYHLAGHFESPTKTETIFGSVNSLFESDNSPRFSVAPLPSPTTQQIHSKQLVPLLTVPRQSFEGWKNSAAIIYGTMYFQVNSLQERRIRLGHDKTVHLGNTETCDVFVPSIYQDKVDITLMCTGLEPGDLASNISMPAAISDGNNIWPSNGGSQSNPQQDGGGLLPALFTPIRSTGYTFHFSYPLYDRKMQLTQIVPGWLDGKELIIVTASRDCVLKLPFHINHVIPAEIDTQAWEIRRAAAQKH